MADEMRKLRKKVRRKRIVKLIIGLVITAAVAVVVIILVNIFFVVKNIDVTNNSSYDTTLMLEDAGVTEGTNIFSVNAEKIYEKLSARYPYIESVTADISLPSSVKVIFTATTAAMSVPVSENKYILISRSGKVLEERGYDDKTVASVTGAQISSYTVGKTLDRQSEGDAGLLLDLYSAVYDKFYDVPVYAIDISKKYSIMLTVGNVSIEMGNSEDMDKKLKMARKVYDDNDTSVAAVINVKDYSKGRYRTVNE